MAHNDTFSLFATYTNVTHRQTDRQNATTYTTLACNQQ